MARTQEVIDYFMGMGKHVFTLNDASKFTSKEKNYLSRLLVTNPKIRKIERNKYYINGADAYEVATNIVEPSYVSLMSAFRYYDMTTQIPVKVSVVTTKRHKALVFNNLRIEFRTINSKRAFGYKKIGNTMMALPEKAILDSLYFGDPSYFDVEEALQRGLNARVIRTRKLVEYAIQMKSGVLINRLGFLLESLGVSASNLIEYKSRVKVVAFGKGTKESKRWNVKYD